MSAENLQQFCLLVLNNQALQKKLREIGDRAQFTARVIELGARHGFEITAGDVEQALRENRRLWLERWI